MQISSVSTGAAYTTTSKSSSSAVTTSSASSTTDTVTLSSSDLEARYEKLVNKSYLTTAENAEATKIGNQVTENENKAFFHYAFEACAAATKKQADGLMAQYYKAYVAYYDSLSPTEQATDRYAGTREAAVANYEIFSASAAAAATTPGSSTGSTDPIVMLLQAAEERLKKISEQNAKNAADSSNTSATSDTSSTDSTASDSTSSRTISANELASLLLENALTQSGGTTTDSAITTDSATTSDSTQATAVSPAGPDGAISAALQNYSDKSQDGSATKSTLVV
ncbi:MAG: hypothetical protein WCD42_02515 [Rhizomicrobium sp.]